MGNLLSPIETRYSNHINFSFFKYFCKCPHNNSSPFFISKHVPLCYLIYILKIFCLYWLLPGLQLVTQNTSLNSFVNFYRHFFWIFFLFRIIFPSLWSILCIFPYYWNLSFYFSIYFYDSSQVLVDYLPGFIWHYLYIFRGIYLYDQNLVIFVYFSYILSQLLFHKLLLSEHKSQKIVSNHASQITILW